MRRALTQYRQKPSNLLKKQRDKLCICKSIFGAVVQSMRLQNLEVAVVLVPTRYCSLY